VITPVLSTRSGQEQRSPRSLEHHEPHFGLVDGAAADHEELLRRFRAEVGSLDDPKSIAALSGRA
jgi:hypothetical protein